MIIPVPVIPYVHNARLASDNQNAENVSGSIIQLNINIGHILLKARLVFIVVYGSPDQLFGN